MPDLYLDVDAALSEVPVNIMPLTDAADFVSVLPSVAYNASGMALWWNFVTSAGAFTQTSVTPTTGGNYDWVAQGFGMYTIEIPASGGASINNDTEGYGWFTGEATGVLPWRGPIIGFRASGLNDKLLDSAYDTTRGLAGTALPAAAAEASGGLPTLSAAQASNGTIQANVHRWLTGTPNALSSGRVEVLVGAVTNGVIAAASFASGALDAVWSTATRVLTAGTNIVLAKGSGVTGFNDLDAAGVRGAVGLATANLDAQLGAISDVTDKLDTTLEDAGTSPDSWQFTEIALENAPSGPGSTPPTVEEIADEVETRAMTLTSAERLAIAAALLDLSNGVETGVTPRGALRLALAALAGKLSGAAGTTVTIRNAVADSKDRIVATVDADGNRTAITTDVT